MQINIGSLVNYLQLFSPEMLSIITLVICYIAIFLYLKYWQETGLYVYIVIAIIVANLQVLKAAYFVVFDQTVALGTIVYCSTFLASDVITEFFGIKMARKAIWISFMSSLFLISLMILTLGHSPLTNINTNELSHFNEAHNALSIIFTPSLAIFSASLIAYIISQFSDIFIFSKIKLYTSNRYLGIRVFISFICATAIDIAIFNILAWKIFSSKPVSWYNLFHSYISCNYIMQIIIAVLNIPVFYILKKFIKCTPNLVSQ